MSFQIPERLVNFRCYDSTGSELKGLQTIDLPSLEAMVETISGAGIAGELESVVLGHFGALMVKLKGRAANLGTLSLMVPTYQALDIRASMQLQDPGAGSILTSALRIACRGMTKAHALGTLEPGKPQGVEIDMAAAFIGVWLDGVEIIVIDKLSMVYRVNGVDYLAKARVDMGGV